MTNEQIVQMIQDGKGDRQQLMMELYDNNRPMIWRTVRPYQRNGNDEDDLMQSSYLALDEAVRRYDPDKGGKFLTYLIYWLRSVVGRDVQELPAHIEEQIFRYRRAVAEYRKQTGLYPEDAYLRIRLKLTQDQLDQLKIIMHRHEVRSLSESLPDAEDFTLEDTLPDPSDPIENLCDRLDDELAARTLWQAVSALDRVQAEAIRLKCQDGQTLQQTADKLHMKKHQARQAIEKGCRKLRRDKRIRQIGQDRGYLSHELYGGSLSSFRNEWSSIVELTALRHLEPEVTHKFEEEFI